MIDKDVAMKYLEYAHIFAMRESGCTKVAVGCAIVAPSDSIPVVFGTNVTVPDWCKTRGCQRVKLYGDNSKDHRGPADCRAVHSEIDAIAKAARRGIAIEGATVYVTRYPCEACARACVVAGIRRVVYGRLQEISQQTKDIFSSAGVEVFWLKDFVAEDVLT